MKVAVFTISTRSYNKLREDKSGPVLCELLKKMNAEIITYKIIDDNKKKIRKELKNICNKKIVDIIFTTGGTGLSIQDVTPEATRSVIKKVVPGISELLRIKSLKNTPMASLSRGISGIRNKTLIINFPGSPKACKECFSYIKDILPHATEILKGEISDCDNIRKKEN